MSPCERSAWIRLLSILIIFTPYFGLVALLFSRGDAAIRPLYLAFVVAAVLHGVVNGFAQIASAAAFGAELVDERDRVIEALSLRVAYYLLITGLLGALSTLATVAVLAPSFAPAPTFVATSQFVFCCVVAAELSRHVTQVVCYRRGVRQ